MGIDNPSEGKEGDGREKTDQMVLSSGPLGGNIRKTWWPQP